MSFFNRLNQFPFAYESQFSRVFGSNCISHSLEEPPPYNCAPSLYDIFQSLLFLFDYISVPKFLVPVKVSGKLIF